MAQETGTLTCHLSLEPATDEGDRFLCLSSGCFVHFQLFFHFALSLSFFLTDPLLSLFLIPRPHLPTLYLFTHISTSLLQYLLYTTVHHG